MREVKFTFLQVADGSLLDDISYEVSLYGLVLGDHGATVLTADALDVAAAVLVATIVPSLPAHANGCRHF